MRAIGGPFDEFNHLVDSLFHTDFADNLMSPCIAKGAHAMAIDEPRKTFRVIPWERDERVTQVWFAGAHSDIGGGYEKQGLATLALLWMIEQAEGSGLKFNEHTKDLYHSAANPHGEVHHPRKGKGLFYRYRHRQILEGSEIAPSTMERLQKGTSNYCPGNLSVDPEQLNTPDKPGLSCGETPFDRYCEGRKSRSLFHMLAIAILVAFVLLTMFLCEQRPGVPPWNQQVEGVMDLSARAVTALVPFPTLAHAMGTPFWVLKTSFWAFACLTGALLCCWVQVSYVHTKMTAAAQSHWKRLRSQAERIQGDLN